MKFHEKNEFGNPATEKIFPNYVESLRYWKIRYFNGISLGKFFPVVRITIEVNS